MAKKKKVEISLEEKLEKALVPVEEQPYPIPNNWVWTRLGEIVVLDNSKNIENEELDYFDVKTLRRNLDMDIVVEKKTSGRIVEKNDLVILVDGENSGEVFTIPYRGYMGSTFKKLKYSKEKMWNYISMFLKRNKEIFKNNKVGSAIPHLNKKLFKEFPFPLPPLNEQKRIVEKLDFLFEKTKRAKEIIEEIKVDIENRKISILDRAFKGVLTSKWRSENKASDVRELLKSINDEKIKKWEEDCLQAKKNGNKKPKKPIITEVEDMIIPVDEQPYELPESWVWTSWKEIAEIFSARRVLQEDWKDKGIPFYRAREIVKLSINGYVDNELFISEEHYLKLLEISRIPKTNDLMVSAVGTLGSTYVVKSEDKFYYKDASVLCVSPKKDINSYYLKYLMESFYMKEQIKLNSKGSTVDTLTISKYENFYLPIPPLEEQQEIVRVLDEVLETENKVKELLELEERIDILEKSILHKAFKGELGTQNSSDESAMELLKNSIAINTKI